MFFYYRNVARWSQRQDRVNKEIFNQFKRKNKPLSITSLKRLMDPTRQMNMRCEI